MHFNKFLILNIICLFIVSCGSKTDSKTSDFTLQTNVKNNIFKLGDTLKFIIENKKEKPLSTIKYFMDGREIDQTLVLNDIKLGSHQLKAELISEETSETLSLQIKINNNVKPQIYGFRVINEFPHDISSYTQGLEFHDDVLYESTGQYNESKLRKVDYKTGAVLKNIDLPNQYFGEGLTILNDKIYQLTWQSNLGFVYDLESMERTETFNYDKSKEGWGLCNNGRVLYKSDGTESIYTLNPENLKEGEKIEVYTNNGKIKSLNELEWINGRIYANIYQRNGVAIINPKNGAVEGVIDFSALKDKVKQHPGLDVLNGIAYNAERNTIFVTGKRWDKLFEVEIFEK